jgi:hypothetical protein
VAERTGDDRLAVRPQRGYLPRFLSLAAAQQLNIEAGDRLLVDVQDGVLVLVPQPEDYAKHLAGLHKEVWAGVDSNDYLRQERVAWTPLNNG